MKTLVATVLSATFCFCLVTVSASKTAKAQVIKTGSLTCTGELQQLQDGLWGCSQPLPVHHLGTGGPGGVNPNDFGMCGLLGVEMGVGEGVGWKDDVQIVVDSSGTYTLQVGVNQKGAKPPIAQWTCVYFSGFKGVPPISDGVGFTPASFSSGSAINTKTISGSAPDACIWAGFLGDLAGTPHQGSTGKWEGEASAQYDKPDTKYSAQNSTSYAFCSGYSGPTWKGWHYLHNTGVNTSTPKNLGINKKDYWCYMDLIQDSISTFGPLYVVNAEINISSTGDYSLTQIFTSGSNSVSMGYNCLPLTQ
jgi:hypothetical protein